MKYAKPEITALGDAASVIQGQKKQIPGSTDFTLPPPRPLNYVPAYDLDEEVRSVLPPSPGIQLGGRIFHNGLFCMRSGQINLRGKDHEIRKA
jgi:hypothetical protein